MPSETLTYRFFAKTYGFTEAMTDDLSVDAVTWWPQIELADAEAQQQRSRQAQRQADRSSRGY